MAKKKGKGKWILLLLIIAGIFLYINYGEKTQETKGPKQLYNVDKTGAGTIVDYTATAKTVHKAVDDALAGARLPISNVQEAGREAPRQKIEGAIRWHARKILLTIPADTKADTVKNILQTALKGSGGQVVGTPVPDEYDGQPVVRLDVGILDTLAGEPLTLITDRIYLTTKKSETVVIKPEGKGKLAIVIDDFGYNDEPIEAFAAINRPLTFSVLPYRQYSNEAASRALSSGHQVMLHLPMEALSSGENPEPTVINVGMSDQEITQIINKAVQAVPGIIGVNNHQGSKATADRRVMKTVLAALKANSLFFMDSRTNSQSVAYDLSRQMGLATGENYLFIDNSSDVESIKSQLRTAGRAAIQHGSVTVIGHARHNTAIAVREMIPELESLGVTLVFESQLVR